MKNMTGLSMNEMEQVSGGYWHYVYDYADSVAKYEAIEDDTGNVLATFGSEDEVVNYCYEHGLNACYLNSQELAALRERANPPGGRTGHW